jgi:hypothetical protein
VSTPKFGIGGSLIYGSNLVKKSHPAGEDFFRRFGGGACGRQFASVQQRDVCADFVRLHDDVARAEGTNGWISIHIWALN